VSETLLAERPMGRKKKAPEEMAPALASVKIAEVEHARLKIVSSVEGRNIADILTEIIRGPVEKRYKAALAKLNEREKG
jgi:hypothetical protein